MPWTLYRYILLDLLKLFVLCVTVLISIMTVAGAIKPLSEGLLLPGTLLKFIWWSMPTMLQLASPFAAAFAATVVFSRLKNDNEVLACAASGMSYRALLLPALFLGLCMTLGLFYASNWWIPKFYQNREQLLFAEDPQVLLNFIDRQQAFRLEDWIVYADRARIEPIPQDLADTDIPPIQRIVLQGVAASRYETGGRLSAETTAKLADVNLFNHRGQAWVTMRLHDVMFFRPDEGVLVSSADFEVRRQRLMRGNIDDPRILSWPELRDLGTHPERFDSVSRARQNLLLALATERALRQAQARLTTPGGSISLLSESRAAGARQYQLTAPSVRRVDNVLVLEANGDQKVTLREQVDGVVQVQTAAESATLAVRQVEDPEPGVRLDVELFDVQVADSRQGAATGRERLNFPRAMWPQPLVPQLEQAGSAQLIQFASEPVHRSVGPVQTRLMQLRKSISRLLHRAIAEIHDRAASSVAALLVFMLAAVLALRQRGGMILVTFFWTFLMTTAVIISIEAGRELSRRPDASLTTGLAVLWAGNLLLLLTIAINYLKLSKN